MAFAVLPLVLSLVIGGELVRSLLVVLAVSPVLIGLQGILAPMIAAGGGLIGSRFLRKGSRGQESGREVDWNMGATRRSLVIPSLLLMVLNTALVLVEVVRFNLLYVHLILHLDLGLLESEDQMTVYLQFLVPYSFLFLLIGVMRGRATGKARSALLVSMLVCLAVGVLGFILLPLLLSVAIGGEVGLSFLIVIAGSPLWMGLQLVLAALGGEGGGLIGGRWLHKGLWPRPSDADSRSYSSSVS